MTINKKIYQEGQTPHLDQVVDQLKRLDGKNKRLMYRMYILYVVFAVFYLGIMILNPDPVLTLANRLQGVLFVLMFVVAALFFRYHYRKTYQADYTAPVLKMLEDARERHKLLRPGKIWFIIFIVATCDLVTTWRLVDHTWPESWSLLSIIVVIQAGYLAVMGISFLIGYLIWRKKSWPLVRNLTKLIEEFKRE